MSDDNGFVERPKVAEGKIYSAGSILARLMATADNGKAISLPFERKPWGWGTELKQRGLRVRSQRQPDGTYLAWCERLPPAAGATP